MSRSESSPARTRREPPPFRRVEVRRADPVTPRMVRVTFAGPDLEGFTVEEPAASVRLLLPSPGEWQPVVPTWRGNEFLLPDGERPIIRTFTPRRVDPESLELDLEIVLHDDGAASAWARSAAPGDAAAVSGPGRGYAIEREAPAFLLAGDETALPAVAQLLEVLPVGTPVQVLIEVARPDARFPLPDHPRATVVWCDLTPGSLPGDALVPVLEEAQFGPATRVWAAGEAAAMQRIRRHLFDERKLARRQTTVRGYWKHGRTGGSDGD